MLPSRREGYGLIVVEAASLGVPTVVVAGPDNAAVELVSDGVNGFVARRRRPEDLADAIGKVAARDRVCARRPPSGSRATRAAVPRRPR